MSYRLPSIGGTDYVVLAGNINNQQALRQKIMNEKSNLSRMNRAKAMHKKKVKEKEELIKPLISGLVILIIIFG